MRCVLSRESIATKEAGMKKQLEKKVLEKEAVLWGKMKNTLDRDEIRVCRK